MESKKDECFLLKVAEALTDTSRETWLCSLSEACALLMTLCLHPLSHCVYWRHTLPKLCRRFGTHRSVRSTVVCVFLVDNLQCIRQSWPSWAFSLPSIPPEVHNEPGVDAHLQRFTKDFPHFGRVCHVAQIHSSICRQGKKITVALQMQRM